MRRSTLLALLLLCSILGAAWITYGYEAYDNLILAKMGFSEIVRYLEGSDQGKSLTEEQIAAKYLLGSIPKNEEPPARVVLQWKTLPLSEQRQLKVIWFREHYRSVPLDEVNKFVNLDYLKARVEAEYRDNPLAWADAEARHKKEMEEKMADKYKAYKNFKGVLKSPGITPKKKTASDTAPRMKKVRPKKKPDAAAVAPEKPKPDKEVVETPKPAKNGAPPNGQRTIKKLPWYGIPNKMKNE